MKNILTFCIGCLAIGAMAQPSTKEFEKHQKNIERSRSKGKVVISLDTVYNKGIAYCVMKVTSKGVMGLGKSYDVYDLQNNNVFVAKANQETGSYDLTFLESGKKVNTPNATLYLEDHLVANNIFENGTLNEVAVRKYLLVNAYNREDQQRESDREARIGNISIGTSRNTQNSDNDDRNAAYDLVERDRSDDVSVMMGKIKQDFKEIGTVKEGTNRDIKTTYTVKTMSGRKVAEGTCAETVGCKSVEILTFKDNKLHQLSIKSSLNADEEISIYLVKLGYL